MLRGCFVAFIFASGFVPSLLAAVTASFCEVCTCECKSNAPEMLGGVFSKRPPIHEKCCQIIIANHFIREASSLESSLAAHSGSPRCAGPPPPQSPGQACDLTELRDVAGAKAQFRTLMMLVMLVFRIGAGPP